MPPEVRGSGCWAVNGCVTFSWKTVKFDLMLLNASLPLREESSHESSDEKVRSRVSARAETFAETFPKGFAVESSDLTVIIPTLNEAGSIQELLRALGESLPGVRVIVVDDASTDGTPEAVRLASRHAQRRATSEIELLERRDASVRGITASVLEAVRACRTPFFVVMDGDLQHPVHVVSELLEKLAHGADLVVASRESVAEEYSPHRALLSRAASLLASWRLALGGIQIDDPLSGFFGMRRARWQEFVPESGAAPRFELRGYKVLFDLLRTITRSAAKVQVAQVHYHFGVRKSGESKLKPSHALLFFRSLFS